MTIVAELFMVAGGLVALLAGFGLLKLQTPYARFHAAGKASPVSFLVAAIGAGIILGFSNAVYLVIAAVAMALTLPVGVHLLFRAVHRSDTGIELEVDELTEAEDAAGHRHR
ncbi:MAG: monovalent cation/H(+) antiporter subunit G [Actinomycetota bacterium]